MDTCRRRSTVNILLVFPPLGLPGCPLNFSSSARVHNQVLTWRRWMTRPPSTPTECWRTTRRRKWLRWCRFTSQKPDGRQVQKVLSSASKFVWFAILSSSWCPSTATDVTWTGCVPICQSGPRCSRTSNSITPQGWCGARVWVHRASS